MADDSTLYTLTVPNYSSNLLTELNNLRTNNLCCDVRICTADEGFLYAHKIVICCVSPYFRERINLTSHEPDTIDLVDTSHHLLTCVINYVYTGTLQVSIVHLQSMVQLLNKLEIKDALAMLEDLRTSCNGNDSITDSDLNETPCSEVAEVNNKEVGCEEEDSSFARVRNLSDNETDIEEYEDIIEQLNHNVDSHKESEDMAEETSVPLVKEKIATKKPRKSVDKKCKTATKRPRKKVAPVKISLKKKVVVTTTADVDGKGDTEFKPLGDDSLNESKVDAQTEAVGDYIVKLEPPDSMDDSFDHNKDSPIKKKVKSDSQSKSKKCKICDEVFPTYKEYLVHRKTHAQSPGGVKKKRIQKKPYLCSICSRAWSSAIRRACHEYSKHGIPFDSSFKLYSCTFEGCNYISANKRYVDNHMRGTHSDERPHVCEYCGKAFKMPGALWTHTNIHTKLKEYKCEDCGMNFHQQSGLDIHKKKHHMGEDSWSELCHLCSEKFLHKGELCWHLFSVHNQPIPDKYKVYTCELCDYKTIRREQFERHKNSHKDERKWPCNICGKTFLTKTYLSRHMQFHGEKKNVCDYPGCGFATADKFGLKSHIKRMHTAKNLKPYACTLCTYKTGVRGNLGKHIRTVHKLEVVTKHTVHHKVKFKDRESGDIITKDGELVQSAKERMEASRIMKMEAGICDFPY